MKKIILLIIALCLITATVSANITANAVQSIHEYTLTTTHDPTRYSTFTVTGDTIEAHGFYKDDEITDFMVIGVDTEKGELDLKAKPDGTYTAVFTGIPESEFATIRLMLKSNKVLDYRVDYDDGWYFPDPAYDGDIGLSEKHINIVESYTTTIPQVTAQYLVGDDAADDAVLETLRELKRITAEITSGIDGDYDKARAVSGWIADNIYYDYQARDNEVDFETIALCNVLEKPRTVCVGYANLTSAMLQAIGLKAVTVIGNAVYASDFDQILTKTNHHEWAAFWYEEENRWVLLDSGWDSLNGYDGEYNEGASPRRYFDVSPLAFAQNHRAVKAEFRDYFALVDEQELLENAENPTAERGGGGTMALSGVVIIAVAVVIAVIGIIVAVLLNKKK